MTDKPLTETIDIALDWEGEHLVLRRLDVNRAVTELRLSQTDVLDLARSIPQFASQNLSDLSNTARDAGMKSVASIRLNHALVAPAALGEAVILGLEDEMGIRASYALDTDLARRIADDLKRKADEADAIAAGRAQ